MLSILIPTYNHNAYQLVASLHEQLKHLDASYEVRVIDDGSTLAIPDNEKITEFPNTHFKKLTKNSGRSAVRTRLANEATFNTLLFLDADVLPSFSLLK